MFFKTDKNSTFLSVTSDTSSSWKKCLKNSLSGSGNNKRIRHSSKSFVERFLWTKQRGVVPYRTTRVFSAGVMSFCRLQIRACLFTSSYLRKLSTGLSVSRKPWDVWQSIGLKQISSTTIRLSFVLKHSIVVSLHNIVVFLFINPSEQFLQIFYFLLGWNYFALIIQHNLIFIFLIFFSNLVTLKTYIKNNCLSCIFNFIFVDIIERERE